MFVIYKYVCTIIIISIEIKSEIAYIPWIVPYAVDTNVLLKQMRHNPIFRNEFRHEINTD